MAKVIKYRVTDMIYKDVMKDLTANEVAKLLGVGTYYVYHSANYGNLIRNRYKIEITAVSNTTKSTIPCELWTEWDRVCKPLNEALKKSNKKILITSLDI